MLTAQEARELMEVSKGVTRLVEDILLHVDTYARKGNGELVFEVPGDNEAYAVTGELLEGVERVLRGLGYKVGIVTVDNINAVARIKVQW